MPIAILSLIVREWSSSRGASHELVGVGLRMSSPQANVALDSAVCAMVVVAVTVRTDADNSVVAVCSVFGILVVDAEGCLGAIPTAIIAL